MCAVYSIINPSPPAIPVANIDYGSRNDDGIHNNYYSPGAVTITNLGIHPGLYYNHVNARIRGTVLTTTRVTKIATGRNTKIGSAATTVLQKQPRVQVLVPVLVLVLVETVIVIGKISIQEYTRNASFRTDTS